MNFKVHLPYLLGLFLGVSILFGFASASADSFNQNRIIDDAVFNNTGSMATGNINTFLNQFPQSCISPKNGFSSPDPIGYSPSTGFTYGGNVSAGQVISDAAQAYGINPQVLLATLEKESSVVTGSASYHCQYINTSMGYGCPDSGSCPTNPATMSGFSKQVIHAAWLFKFGEQRSEGNINWAVVKGGWDNSDDPQTCYGGPMTQGTWVRCPSGAAAYYDGYTTIDGAAVHMDDGSSATLYWYTPHFHGNQLFFNIFTSWFGSTTLPNAFKIDANPQVYVQAAGYRFYVPSISVLQDFGFGTGAQTITQTVANNIPPPDANSGYSSSISNVVEAPSDPSIYFVSNGIKYLFSTPQQMTDFGYGAGNISYLPASFINSIPSGGVLSNYVQTPNYSIFQISGGTKRFIFDGSTYASLNPSGLLSRVSNTLTDSLPAGSPLGSQPILFGTSSGAIYLFVNSNYYYVPSSEVLGCWGFNTSLNMQPFWLPQDSYVAPIVSAGALSCINKVDNTTTYLLNGSNKISLPSSYGFALGSVNADLTNVASRLLTRSSPLGQVIQATNSPIVWYLEGGTKKGIPSLEDLRLLSISASQIDRVSSGVVNALPGLALKMGVGQVARESDTGGIYVVTSPTTKSWITTGDTFGAYGYSWSSIDSFPSSAIDQFYTTDANPLSRYMYTLSGGVYLMDANGCYGLTSSQIDAYGQPHTANLAGQTYAATIFPYLNLVNCKNGSIYVKSPSQYTIYEVDSGLKHPISTWSKLQSISGQSNPPIILLSDSTLASLPTGSVL